MMTHALTLLALLSLSSCTTDAFAEWKGDPRIPDYGSSAQERRHETGKHYPGDQYGTPYAEPKSNGQRWNEEEARRDAAGQQRRETQRESYQDKHGGQFGGCTPYTYGC